MSIDDLKELFEEEEKETDELWALMILALILQPKEPTFSVYIERKK